MKASDLVKDLIKEKLNITLGKEIGYGAQGQVFEIEGNSVHIIKISILYDVHPTDKIQTVFNNIMMVYDYISKSKSDNMVKILEFHSLKNGSRTTTDGEQEYIIYYSIQEKLIPLSDDEKKVFKTICQAYNNELDSEVNVEHSLYEVHPWMDFNFEKAISFYKNLSTSVVKHNDFHRRNIMKDARGNYKVIDFDLAELRIG